ncbi:MAG: hypothetical protein H5T86_15455, partial [Armatimonadetes bacterium]|nr:hypothetical protein [Armatimonadota bacterium]
GDWWNDTWKARISPYVKNTQLFGCPSAPAGVNPPRPPNSPGTGPYGINAYIGEVGTWQYLALATHEQPAQTILLGENMDGDWVVEPNPAYWSPAPYPAPGWIKEAHFEGSNVAFCDGHVKWMKLTEIHKNDCWLWLPDKP